MLEHPQRAREKAGPLLVWKADEKGFSIHRGKKRLLGSDSEQTWRGRPRNDAHPSCDFHSWILFPLLQVTWSKGTTFHWPLSAWSFHPPNNSQSELQHIYLIDKETRLWKWAELVHDLPGCLRKIRGQVWVQSPSCVARWATTHPESLTKPWNENKPHWLASFCKKGAWGDGTAKVAGC